MNYILLIILLIAGFFIARYIYQTYNEFIHYQTIAKVAKGNINSALQKRFDMLPALAETIDRYVEHEDGVFSKISRLRSQWSQRDGQFGNVQSAEPVQSILSKLIALEEKYPSLKADKNFRNMQRNIADTEIEVLARREEYNFTVGDYNVRLRTFPKNIVAALFMFKEMEFVAYNE